MLLASHARRELVAVRALIGLAERTGRTYNKYAKLKLTHTRLLHAPLLGVQLCFLRYFEPFDALVIIPILATSDDEMVESDYCQFLEAEFICASWTYFIVFFLCLGDGQGS